MVDKFFLFIFCFVSLSLPFSFVKALQITEIMYDHEGTDTKREWIEIFNDTDSGLDITSFKLREADSNHLIKEYRGGKIVPQNGFAIIADSPADIISEIPENTVILDSVFSLSNSGEELALLDGSNNQIFSIFYDPTIGGNGNGKTLQKIDDVWVANIASPGSQNDVADNSQSDIDDTDIAAEPEKELGTTNSAIIKKYDDNFNLIFNIPEFVYVGEGALFATNAVDQYGDIIPFVNYSINFGDGLYSMEKEVAHIYKKTGTYLLFAEAKTDSNIDFVKQKIVVREFPVELLQIDNDFFLSNNSSFEFNISGFAVSSKGRVYKFPPNTFLVPKGKIILSSSILGFNPENDISVITSYGNIILLSQKTENKILNTKTASVASGAKMKVSDEEERDIENTDITTVKEAEKPSQTIWFVVFGLILACGLILLYFVQKKHNLIDEIEISS